MLDAYSALRDAGTAVIADVFDSMKLAPQVLDNGIGFVGGVHAFAGPAYTVTGEPATYAGGDLAKLGAIDAMPTGAVAVWASMDAVGVCCFGDLLATSMVARGCIAAVVDGGIDRAAQQSHETSIRHAVADVAKDLHDHWKNWKITASALPSPNCRLHHCSFV